MNIVAGLALIAQMAGAMLLGWLVGYERFSRGRAAGSEVYCLVSATSCAITELAGHPALWYGGAIHEAIADPTRVTGPILTGIGFLGAGIIMQTGMSVRGLTTAASIWGSSAIGILFGSGLHLPAVGLTGLFIAIMAIVPRVEHRLPARVTLSGRFRFKGGYVPDPEAIRGFMVDHGLTIPDDAVSIGLSGGQFEMECLIYCSASSRHDTMNRVAIEMAGMEQVESFTVMPSSRE